MCSDGFVELHGGGVHAVAEAGGFGAVVEDMAEVGIAERARDGGAAHADAVVGGVMDILFGDWLPEAWPAGARVKFGLGTEERDVAADTTVNTVGVLFVGGAGVGAFSAGAAGDFIGDGGELLLPFLIGLDDALFGDFAEELAVG